MKKLIFFLLMTSLTGFITADPGHFPYMSYEKAVVYRMTDYEQESIMPGGKLSTHVIEGTGDTLDATEIEAFLNIIEDTTTYNDIYFRCFSPRHGVVFYNAANEPVAHFTICIECHEVKITPGLRSRTGTEEAGKLKAVAFVGLRKLAAFINKIYPEPED